MMGMSMTFLMKPPLDFLKVMVLPLSFWGYCCPWDMLKSNKGHNLANWFNLSTWMTVL